MKLIFTLSLLFGFSWSALCQENVGTLSIVVEDYYGDLGLGKVKGVRVVAVGDNSDFTDSYLKKDDLIIKINGFKIKSISELNAALADIDQSPIEIEYSRKGKKNTDEISIDYIPSIFMSKVEYSKSGKIESWLFEDKSQLLMNRGEVMSYIYMDEEGFQITIDQPKKDTTNQKLPIDFKDKLLLIENLQKDKRSELDQVKNILLIKESE